MIMDRRTLLASGLLAGAASWRAEGMMASPPATPSDDLPDAPEVISLWPNKVGPGQLHPIAQEIVERSKDPALPDRAIHGISHPRMVVFRPKQPNGAAVLITPGGGYDRVVIDREGYEMARLLATRGFTCFVLFYRLPGEGWASGPDTALIDAQRAIRIIRHRAGQYGIDPARVAAMGFSAGGHLCADLSSRFDAAVYAPMDAVDALPARPFCSAPIYPVISMTPPLAHAGSRREMLGDHPSAAQEAAHSPDRNIPATPPPHFLLHAEDDPAVPVGNTLALRDALKAKGARVECHLFELGGHGFGLRNAAGKPVAIWPQLWLNWAQTTGLVKQA